MERHGESATYTCPKCRRKIRVLADEYGDHGCVCGWEPIQNEEEDDRMTVKLSVSELEDIAIEGVGTSEDGAELRVVEEGEWIGGGKYEDKTVIFTDGERFYRGIISRSGSHFSDWTYNSEWDDGDADIEEVRKVPKTIEVWEAIN